MFEVKRLLAVAAGLGLALALAGGTSAAEGETKAKTPYFRGTVKVVKAEDGKVTVTLTVTAKDKDAVVYNLAGDKVKDLEGMDGKVVVVIGQVEEKDGAKTITVESFHAAREHKKPATEEKPVEVPATK
jgi:hypothetical protein